MNQQVRVSPARDWKAPFTAAEFLHMLELGAFEDMRAELVRGEIEKMMPAEWTHGELTMRVGALIFPLAKTTGARVGTDVVIKIDELTVRAVDVVVVRPEASPHKVLHGAEVLFAAEIAETTHKRDLGEKREEYGAAGIPTYWVLDSLKQVTHCFQLDASGRAYGDAEIVPFGQAMEIPGLPGTITIE
ncbi:Uma2 family endonuclease [Sphingomonas sp. KR3-1]|uniref:Uma2 family endonuclease n=1 Tax=Sphingomonas sp. KR3-1 TaxID=3156611 RepID=UPI0032B45CBE